jgi:hypothetical protein
MAHDLIAGDFLVFQLESGYGLLRLIAVDGGETDAVWHVAAYDEFFLDVEHAELSIRSQNLPKPSQTHIALTNRAFLSTQVAKLVNVALKDSDVAGYREWLEDSARKVSDRSVRLMMGLR